MTSRHRIARWNATGTPQISYFRTGSSHMTPCSKPEPRGRVASPPRHEEAGCFFLAKGPRRSKISPYASESVKTYSFSGCRRGTSET